jgi:hypothetical protein
VQQRPDERSRDGGIRDQLECDPGCGAEERHRSDPGAQPQPESRTQQGSIGAPGGDQLGHDGRCWRTRPGV